MPGTPPLSPNPRVVILGGGVIGACSALQLSLRGARVTVVERAGVACAASGKAGGFLAKDWQAGGATGGLAERSFAMHEELAREAGPAYGFRRVDTYSVSAGREKGFRKAGGGVDWVDAGRLPRARLMGTQKTTAQVHPYLFTHTVMARACAAGAEVLLGTVAGLRFDADKAVKGVEVAPFAGLDSAVRDCEAFGYRPTVVEGEVLLEADFVVIALGPWSHRVQDWLPEGAKMPRVEGLKAHSIVLKTSEVLPPQCLFVDLDDEHPEFYPRPDGTLYICGQSAPTLLPTDPCDIAPEPSAASHLEELASHLLSPSLAGKSSVETRQACYLPVNRDGDGEPALGFLRGCEGVVAACGHSVWGINNGPATGLVVAELVMDGAVGCADVKAMMDRKGRVRC
ncbi:FAD dependent oxidoreductase [Hyaloraphidium curvatum]|nr:FAD dependent oxidoreductase [Hyaloraphidium curvatum]